MAEITAALVKDLRERSGAGMMDCKNALVEAGGDMDKALEVLQKKGQAKASKAAGRIAADGGVFAEITSDGKSGILVEVNCQTDFVARGDDFVQFAKLVAKTALVSNMADATALETHVVDGKSLSKHAEELTAKSGEKHAIRRLQRFDVDSGVVTAYIHHGARLGVLVEVTSPSGNTPAVKEMADEVALQIASMGPKFTHREEVPADSIAKQREIFVGQLKTEEEEAAAEYNDFKARIEAEGGEVSDKAKEHVKSLEKKAKSIASRPQQAKDKILDGKVNKWLTEIVLLDQVSVRDSSKTVKQLLAETPDKIGVKRFVRFELGEGVDKGAAKDFATEVAEMAAAAQKS